VTDPITEGGQEIGDLCAWTNIQRTMTNGELFVTQPLWSNLSGSCVQGGGEPVPVDFVGCFADEATRDLTGPSQSTATQTPQECKQWCGRQGFPYAGLQYGSYCFCGDSIARYGTSTACTMPCSGDSSQTCGGGWANSVYQTGYLGCFADQSTRDLSGPSQSSATETPGQCSAWCGSQGYEYAGVQYGSYCFCGHAFDHYGPSFALPILGEGCSMPCSGDSGEICGGAWANSIYKTGYLGCFADSSNRDLSGNSESLPTQSPQVCSAWCGSQGFKYAGVQYGSSCFCGNSYGKYGTATDCNMACSGNGTETCGGAWANSVYETGL
jgi:glucan endo-1,3-alpha-glucosidase